MGNNTGYYIVFFYKMKGKKTPCHHLTRKIGLLIVDGVTGRKEISFALKSSRLFSAGFLLMFIYGGTE